MCAMYYEHVHYGSHSYPLPLQQPHSSQVVPLWLPCIIFVQVLGK